MTAEVTVRRLPLVAAALVGLLALGWLLWPAPTVPSAHPSAVAPVPGLPAPDLADRALPPPVHPEAPPPPDRGANGRPVEVEPGRELRRQALPDREPLPPADAATWEKRRHDRHAHWAEETQRLAAIWLEGRSEPERTQVLAALHRFTTAANGVRARIATGAMRPAEGRSVLSEARGDVDAEVRAVLGDDTDALRAHLREHLLGGGW